MILTILVSNSQGTGKAAFGPNYERLVQLKKRYDATNVFSRGIKLMES